MAVASTVPVQSIRSATKIDPHTLSPAASAHLDMVRALAASLVLWNHLRSLFFADFRSLAKPGLAIKAIYFFTGFGHQGVIVFFVLSGFLISSAIMKRNATRTWSWRDYAIDRSSRLYVVLIPGLLFGLLWDKAGSSLFALTGIYARPLVDFGNDIPLQNLTLRNFVGNLFFLQTILCHTFGSNGPLWSLANEFWYYMLFPVSFFAVVAWAKRAFRVAIPLTLASIAIAIFIGGEIRLGFLIWLAGWILVLAYGRWRLRGTSRWLYFWVLASVLLLCLVAARTGRLAPLGADVTVGLAFALFLFGLLQLDFGAPPVMYHRMASFFAAFSYSLYVLHLPFLLFFRVWVAPLQRWQPDAAHLAFGLLLGTIAIAFAWLVSLVTENRTRDVRGRLRQWMPGHQAAELRSP